jgi:hypothetical protein
MAKLTLNVEPDRIEKAKRYAMKHHTSISKLVSNFLVNITEKDDEHEDEQLLKKIKTETTDPGILALRGILKGKVPDDVNIWDYKYEHYLKEKHGL